MRSLAFALLLSTAALAQSPDSCFVCLTRAEAVAAADSALHGQAAAQNVKTMAVIASAHASEADDLRRANQVLQMGSDSLRHAGTDCIVRLEQCTQNNGVLTLKLGKRGRMVAVLFGALAVETYLLANSLRP